MMHLDFVGAQVNSEIGVEEMIIGKIFLYNFPLVPTAYDEFIYPVIGIDFHDVPKNGLLSNFHHWLRSNSAFFTYPSPETSC